ncbi:hypothetical protein LUW77_19520 [Streptomyces radiopugnans]|nr:hypothetical protein LUW77_19520 [Streptomyces radiopugnans]
MKLRRALAAAAATAVIAPVALIAAPAAYADDHETTSVENTETPAPEKTEVEETEPPVLEETEDEETETPAPEKTEDEETEPPVLEETEEEKTETPAPEKTEDEETETPAPGDDEGKDEDEAPFQCAVDEDGEEIYDISEDLKTSLVGLPDTVVAGTGWKNFEFRMHNSGKGAIKDVAPYITVFSGDENNDYSVGFTLEVHKAETGTWQVVADELGAGGYFEPVTLNAGETRTLKLRMKIDGGVPDSLGIAIGAKRVLRRARLLGLRRRQRLGLLLRGPGQGRSRSQARRVQAQAADRWREADQLGQGHQGRHRRPARRDRFVLRAADVRSRGCRGRGAGRRCDVRRAPPQRRRGGHLRRRVTAVTA